MVHTNSYVLIQGEMHGRTDCQLEIELSSLNLMNCTCYVVTSPSILCPVDQLQELNELLSLDQVLTLLQLGNSSLFSSSTSSTMGWEQFFCGESGGDFGELQGTVNRVILGNSYQQG